MLKLLFSYSVIAMMLLVSCGGKRSSTQQAVEETPPFAQEVPEGWESLMDGNTLSGWEIVRYGGEGEPYVKNGVLTLPMATGGMSTGVCWVGDDLPVNNYELYYEARRVEGNDIFGGLSFPYGDSFATLIIGGWAGIVNGLSCIDGKDASQNETTKHHYFSDQQWHPVRLRVTADSIRAFVDTVKVVDISTAGKRIHLRSGTVAAGLTFNTYLTTGEIRNIRIKSLP